MTPAELLECIEEAAQDQATELDLSGEDIKELPPEIGRLTSLERLTVVGNELTSLPPEIGQLTQLTSLSLASNRLMSLPPELGELTDLTDLDLSENQLTSLPPEIGQLTSLSELWLGDNELTSLPPEIGQLAQLTQLDLGYNRLETLPPEILQLTRLTLLLLYQNELASVPSGIGQLTQLNRLDVDGNQLMSLPSSIGQLSKLVRLDVGADGANPLTMLPPELGRLEALQELKLEGIELIDPPPEVVEQGTKAILAYLREQLPEEPAPGEVSIDAKAPRSRPVWESKLLVVGEGGVGKTQLLRALSGEAFQAGAESETTWGIDVRPWELPHPEHDDVTMTLKCWDFGGQNIYHATHQFFLTRRSLFLLAWNARLGWEQGNLHYWLDTIQALAPDSPVMLVATHIDERAADLPLDDLVERFPQVVGEWSVSNAQPELNDNGVDRLREAITTHAASLPLMGSRWPDSYWKAAKSIRGLNEKHIPASRLWAIMESDGVSEDGRPVLAGQLHELGDLLYFDDDEELQDTVLVKPTWVTKRISDVLVHPEVIDGQGVFQRDHMDKCWPDLDPTLRERLLRLMEKFDLSYRIPDDAQNRSLVVERLSLDPAPYEELWDGIHQEDGCREIRMKFDPQSTRPAGIPTWFIARSHRFTTDTHWKYGALFQDDRTEGKRRHLALLNSSSQHDFVELSVRGPNPYTFFALLRDGLEVTFDRFPGLKTKIKRTVPCPELKDGSPCTGEFDLFHLERRLTKTPPTDKSQCEVCDASVSIPKLLFGLHWTTEDAVLERLDEINRTTRHTQKQTGQILYDLSDLRELTQRQFTYQFNRDQRLEESHCPRVFSLRPQEQKSWPKLADKLFDKKWTLQLYCEEPGCWHPAPGGGEYTIDEPAQWKNTLAPYVRRLAKVFKYAAPLVAPGLGFFTPALGDLMADDVKLMTALVKKLDVKPDRDLKAEHGLEGTDKTRVGGASLRSLRHLLTGLDAQQEWGGLQKTLTPEGHWLWLCKEHAEVYRQ